MNIMAYIKFSRKINIYKGFFRLSFFISFAVFVWAAFLEAPKYFPVAFGFTEEDKKEIIEKYGEMIERYKSLTGKQYPEKIKENPDYFIEWYFGRGSQFQLGQQFREERKGKPCGNTSCEILNRAIDRVIDNECVGGWWIDYSGGSLVNNKTYNIIPKCPSHVYEENSGFSIFYPSEEGYSIIPGFKGKIKFIIACGLLFAIPTFIFSGLILPFLLNVLMIFILYSIKYLSWVVRGFL